jgi:hypothetical protein
MSRWILMAVVLVCGLSEVVAAQSNARVCGRRGTFENLESVGLTADGRLICFRERQPAQAREIAAIGGLMGGERIIGIDFRPADGRLYGLGNAGGVYVIDSLTAAATRISMLTSNGARVPLRGTSIGIDFNPVPDRLRTVSEAGQNLRINVDTGATLVDTSLTNPEGGPEGGVTAVAYTNNDASPGTNTVLYDLDIVEDQLYIQAPPNAGSLNQVGLFGMDVTAVAGFDIFSEVKDGRTMRVRALSALVISGQTLVSQIDLATAQVVPGKPFAATNAVIDIAIPLIQGRGNQ